MSVADATELVRLDPTYEGEAIYPIPIARSSPPVLVDPAEGYRLEPVDECGMGIVVAYVAPSSAPSSAE